MQFYNKANRIKYNIPHREGDTQWNGQARELMRGLLVWCYWGQGWFARTVVLIGNALGVIRGGFFGITSFGEFLSLSCRLSYGAQSDTTLGSQRK